MQAPDIHNMSTSLEALFTASMAKSFSDVCTVQWKIAVSDEPRADSPEISEAAVFRFLFAAPLAGEAFLLIRHEELVDLGLRGISSSSKEFSEEHNSVLLQTFQAVANDIKNALAEHGPSSIVVEHSAAPILPNEHRAELWLQAEEKKRLSIQLFFDHALSTAFQNSVAEVFSYPAAPANASSNLNLVLDVELNVTLRFGQRQLPLREILDLTSGSVVELDRQVDEPVELVLDGKVVARGEAVIIDGNYGIRISQVLQPFLA